MEAASTSHPGDAIKQKAYLPGHRNATMARIKRERHTFKILATISISLLLSAGPGIVVQFIDAFIPSIHVPEDLTAALLTFTFVNSLMNVIIYIMRDSKFRKCVADIFKCT